MPCPYELCRFFNSNWYSNITEATLQHYCFRVCRDVTCNVPTNNKLGLLQTAQVSRDRGIG